MYPIWQTQQTYCFLMLCKLGFSPSVKTFLKLYKHLMCKFVLTAYTYIHALKNSMWVMGVKDVPKVTQLPEDTGTASPGLSRFSSTNVPLVLSKSVTRRLPPSF